MMYDDDYPSRCRTFVTLRLFGVHPAEVSQMLPLCPDRIRVQGARWRTPQGPSSTLARWHGWFFSSRGRLRSRDVQRHLDWLLDRLEPHAGVLRRLRTSGCRMEVACFWESAWEHGGPSLSPATMRRLADLGLEVRFDVGLSATAGDDEPPSTVGATYH